MIYFIQQGDDAGPIKIGFATTQERLRQRLSALQIGSAYPLTLRAAIEGTRADEAALHQNFACHRIRGEWFEATDHLFSATASPEDAEELLMLVKAHRSPGL